MLHDLQGLGSLTTIWRHLSDTWDNGGSLEEIAQEAERSRRDRTRRVEQARPADPTEMATSQAAAG